MQIKITQFALRETDQKSYSFIISREVLWNGNTMQVTKVILIVVIVTYFKSQKKQVKLI